MQLQVIIAILIHFYFSGIVSQWRPDHRGAEPGPFAVGILPGLPLLPAAPRRPHPVNPLLPGLQARAQLAPASLV